MPNILARKLESFGPLPEDDRHLIASLTTNSHMVDPDIDVIREGDRPNDVNLILTGFAYRYKLLSNGKRQIVGYLMPGDICDLHVCVLDVMDHSIATLTETKLAKISRESVAALLERPAISRALFMATLVDEAVAREWLTNMGQRSAERRLAHFFCEWHLRLKVVGLANGGECELPITQTELGDTVGLSTVHVNRSVQSLREQGLITLRSQRLVIPDIDRLQRISGFHPNYLHLAQTQNRPTTGNDTSSIWR